MSKAPTRLSADVRPIRYELRLHVDPRRDDFSGEVEIETLVPAGTRALELHAVDLEIDEVGASDARGAIALRPLRKSTRRETLRIPFRRASSGDVVRLRLGYRGALRGDLRGLYLARKGRRRYAATQLEAADARRFFPCFDEPDKKARFEISVVTPLRNEVVSNAPVARVEKRGRTKTVRFAETPPLSTYLIALVVGELERSRPRRCGSTPIRVWHVPGNGHLVRFALECAAESLVRLEKYFGLPYPYAKLDLLAVPDFEFGAMENAGAVTFRETLLLLDPKTATLAEKKRVAEVIAHELAHMWYGDLVTMAWWDDLWLNEAFATWMAFTVVDDWKPEWGMWLDFMHGRGAALALDALANTHPIYATVETPDQATENFDLITYEKGASVVRMIERWLGAAVFRRGVRRYIRDHREGNAVAADLWEALEKAAGRAVEPVVRAWIERPGFPFLEVERANGTLRVRQSRCLAGPRGAVDEPPWPIPALFRVQPTRGRTQLLRPLIQRAAETVELPVEEYRFVYANAEEAGFYRPLHRGALQEGLQRNLQRLAPAERMGLIGHQWAGLRAARAPLEDLLGLVEALAAEKEPRVLEAATGPLAWLSHHTLPELRERDQARFRSRLVEIFGPALDALGWKPARGEAERERIRRAALLRLVADLGGSAALEPEIDSRLAAWWKDRSSLEPNLVGLVVELAARRGDARLYERYLRAMKRAATPQERSRFELALAAFRAPDLVRRTLALALTDDVPTQDVVPLLVRLFHNPAARETAWEFVTTRWEELSPRVSTGLASRLVDATSELRTRAHRREVAAFFRAHPLPSARRALKQSLERFDLERELRQRTRAPLRAWLEKEIR